MCANHPHVSPVSSNAIWDQAHHSCVQKGSPTFPGASESEYVLISERTTLQTRTSPDQNCEGPTRPIGASRILIIFVRLQYAQVYQLYYESIILQEFNFPKNEYKESFLDCGFCMLASGSTLGGQLILVRWMN